MVALYQGWDQLYALFFCHFLPYWKPVSPTWKRRFLGLSGCHLHWAEGFPQTPIHHCLAVDQCRLQPYMSPSSLRFCISWNKFITQKHDQLFFFLRKIKQCKVEFISSCLCSFLMDIIRGQKWTNMGLSAWDIFAPSNRRVIHTFLLFSFISTWVVCPWPRSLFFCYWFSMRSVLVEYRSSYFIA